MDVAPLYRNVTLAVASAPFVKSVISRYGWRVGVGRFVAGEDVSSAVPALLAIQQSGRRVILDLLGEAVGSERGARAVADEIEDCLVVTQAAGVEPYLSVKPTQLGLGVSPELAFELADRVVRRALSLGGHVCLDMENVPFVGGTLDLFERLREAGHQGVSTVLQSYLYRTPEDLERVIELAKRYSGVTALRLVKGAYNEAPQDAIPDVRKVDDAYRTLAFRALEAGLKLNIATHDEALLRELLAYARGARLGPERYEVQMLYGVRPQLQERLTAQGHPVRVYVPFGADWYGYYSRRLAERPANLAFVVRGLFG
ncbi:MAG: proline dehydrogenase family protein [Truepera sp.]|jgi:proline dehydrogenase|nr:proline dehydrogenase family protein [Truepera sp.]